MTVPRPQRLTAVVDVGASAIDAAPPYQRMLEDGLCTVMGFDPQAALLPPQSAGARYFPDVIGDGAPATLFVCDAPGMTGLYELDPRAASLFPGFAQWGRIIEERRVETHRLEDLAFVEHIDFLKIDAQGSEIPIIESAGKKLEETVFVQAEVQFQPLYRRALLFAEFDQFMHGRGFILHTFTVINLRMIRAADDSADPHAPGSQIFAADAVYVRDFGRLDALGDEALKHMAAVAAHCYGSHDLAARCTGELVRRQGRKPAA